jgi:transposase
MTVQVRTKTDFLSGPDVLSSEITLLKEENASLRNKLTILTEQLEWFKRQIFGHRSEKIKGSVEEAPDLPNFVYLETQEQQVETQAVAGYTKKKHIRNGKDSVTLPDGLPVETQVIDVTEEEKVCKETGESLVKIGEEVSRKLAHRPGSYYVKEIIRPKYAAPKNPDMGIVTAELPESFLPRCQVDESFLAEILVRKYGDHLPLYRQTEILAREGIHVSRQLLCQWVIKSAMALKPLHQCMARAVLESGNAFVDETPIQMLDPGKGKTQQGYMWVLVGGKERDPCLRVYDFYENRKHSNAEKLLKGYTGVLHSDKYGAYESMANAGVFTWCPCWSHIRRKFFEAEAGDPKFRSLVLRKIKYLFMFEKVAWTRSPEERLRIRQEKEAPIIDELVRLIRSRLIVGKILPKSKLKEAIGYFLGLEPHLKNYIQHPFARLDNNVAERAVRPLAIGRKNWLFVGNEAGGEAAAIVYSLIQSCRASNINPREYLEDVMRRIMDHPHNKLSELLPMHWAAARKATPSPLSL